MSDALGIAMIEALLTLSAGAAAFPALFLFLEVASAVVTRKKTARPLDKHRASVAVLIPAHNEARLIEQTLASLIPQLGSRDRLVVIADNCTDATADLAAAAGAEVIERVDSTRRGKGYALDFGVRHLAGVPPDVVLVVDADCVAEQGLIDQLIFDCTASGRPAQALYLMRCPENASLKARLGELAWILKNLVRPLGARGLRMPCQLMGSGMALPWRAIENVALASGSIVEDLALGVDLALKGAPPLFCPSAVVTSRFPEGVRAQTEQRTRWEHGHLSLMLERVPRLLGGAIRRRDFRLFWLALDLSVPPLAFLALVLSGLLVINLIFFLLTGAAAPAWLAAAGLILVLASVLLGWAVFGRQAISPGQLALAPVYALAKMPLYLAFFFRKQTQWIRSKRDGE